MRQVIEGHRDTLEIGGKVFVLKELKHSIFHGVEDSNSSFGGGQTICGGISVVGMTLESERGGLTSFSTTALTTHLEVHHDS